ncbi:hypothetical protein MKEN_01457300 [Mycena kentingensis (nom. inval.)]|nr:hypothetical protein MKEN_01457300 [Mycena kentingensis (nom. inval.)]
MATQGDVVCSAQTPFPISAPISPALPSRRFHLLLGLIKLDIAPPMFFELILAFNGSRELVLLTMGDGAHFRCVDSVQLSVARRRVRAIPGVAGDSLVDLGSTSLSATLYAASLLARLGPSRHMILGQNLALR